MNNNLEEYQSKLEQDYADMHKPKPRKTDDQPLVQHIDIDITNYGKFSEIEKSFNKIRRLTRDSLPFYLQSSVRGTREVLKSSKNPNQMFSASVLKIDNKGLSVSFDPDKKQYRLHETPYKRARFETQSYGEMSTRQVMSGYDIIISDPRYFDTQDELFAELWQSAKRISCDYKGEENAQIKKRLYKVFAGAALACGLLYACSSDAAELADHAKDNADYEYLMLDLSL